MDDELAKRHAERVQCITPFFSVTINVAEPGIVYVTKPSMLSNQIHTMTIETNYFELTAWLKDRALNKPTKMVQEQFPHLTNEEREFLLTGITPEEWAKAFPPEDDDEG